MATVSIHDGARVAVAGVPCLVRAFRCDAPLDPPARIYFGAATSIVIGRGDLIATITGTGLEIRVPDNGMSTNHARITRRDGGWIVEDAGSKNGTTVDGRPLTSPASLVHGTVIEIGHTFFVFHDSMPPNLGSEPLTIARDTNGLALTTFNPSLARQFEMLARVAGSTLSVVILGETGTGKEVVARALHRLSGRKGAFIAVNCGAIPATLIESELFGIKKGAFSGATEDRPGLFRAADGGTIFLDELGELPPAAQVALLRVVQENEVTPIGGVRPIQIDARVVTATHRPLEALVEKTAFRSDLYARLAGLTVRLEPLRGRREDLGLIIASVLRRIAPDQTALRFSRLAARALFTHPFSRNVRELEKALRLAVAIAPGGAEIDLEHLPEILQSEPREVVGERDEDDEPAVESEEGRKARLVELLTAHKGQVAAVARDMGKARMQIHRWIQRYELDLESYRRL
ncbi:MAG: sigma 54-interacting transcriptional regulator [Deltaproteobacteria bacterium]|nr:sigma 54-interacting transcriptional regulator [Deltaproteobacteria bacterium]